MAPGATARPASFTCLPHGVAWYLPAVNSNAMANMAISRM